MTNNETMAASMSRTKKGTVALLKLYILYALMVGLFLVTAVMFHSCVVCAVTAGDVVNSQLARLGAMIIVYSMSIVFFLILDSVSHVDAVRQFFSKSLSFLKKPASATRHATA